MPLVRIDHPAGKPRGYRAAVSEIVSRALTDTVDVPPDDRFHVLTEHDSDGLAVDPGFLGIRRTAEAVLIQITLSEGRGVAKKKALYRAIADGLHERLGLRREDVFINLVEVKRENWSFGNGEAQYVA